MHQASEGIFAACGAVALRRLQNTEEDMALLHAWLTDPQVVARAYQEGVPWTMDKVRRAFADKTRATGTMGCIILRDGQPVGYVQYYPVHRDSYAASPFAQSRMKGAYGVDMFIGIPSLWHKGIGRAVLTALGSYLRDKGVRALCADPSAENDVALRFWPSQGFDPLEVIEDYDDPSKQCVLMMKPL